MKRFKINDLFVIEQPLSRANHIDDVWLVHSTSDCSGT